jgi:predicted Zn-dependent peptidase
MSALLQTKPLLGPPTSWRFPSVSDRRLDTGLRLLAVDLPGKLLASACLLVDLPSDADPAGREGLALMAARSLTEGTVDRSAEALADALASQGASLDACASDDGLRVTLTVPASRLPHALPLLADVVQQPAFPRSDVERVLRQRLAAIAHERDSPPQRAGLELPTLIWDAGCRAARPVGGDAQSIGRLTPEQIAAAWSARSSSATSTMVLAGDLGAIDVEGLASTCFGAWGSATTRWVPRTPPTRGGHRVLVVHRPGSVQTQLHLGHAAPNRTSPDYSAMTLAAYAVGGTLTSRIDAVLREEKGYTYGMRAGFTPLRRTGAFSVSGSVDTLSTGAALNDLRRVLRTAVDGGLTGDELVAARDFLVGVSPMRWETADAVAAQVSAAIANDLPLSWTDGFLDGMRSATLDDVNRALRGHVHPDELNVVVVGDAATVVPAVEELGLGSPTVIDL